MEQIIHRGTPKPSQPLATDVLADIADCCTDGLENVARLRNLYVRSGQADEPAVLELEREFRELHSSGHGYGATVYHPQGGQVWRRSRDAPHRLFCAGNRLPCPFELRLYATVPAYPAASLLCRTSRRWEVHDRQSCGPDCLRDSHQRW